MAASERWRSNGYAVAPLRNTLSAPNAADFPMQAAKSHPRRVANLAGLPIFGILCHLGGMIVIGTGLVEGYLANHTQLRDSRIGHYGMLSPA